MYGQVLQDLVDQALNRIRHGTSITLIQGLKQLTLELGLNSQEPRSISIRVQSRSKYFAILVGILFPQEPTTIAYHLPSMLPTAQQLQLAFICLHIHHQSRQDVQQ
jgi:hypothetical protein